MARWGNGHVIYCLYHARKCLSFARSKIDTSSRIHIKIIFCNMVSFSFIKKISKMFHRARYLPFQCWYMNIIYAPITGHWTVGTTVYALCEPTPNSANPAPLWVFKAGEFCAQRASNAEKSINFKTSLWYTRALCKMSEKFDSKVRDNRKSKRRLDTLWT